MATSVFKPEKFSATEIEKLPAEVGNPDGSHCVYVVRLDQEVTSTKKFIQANPQWPGDGLCLYVGLTGLTPQERFENHQSGYKASRWVQRHGAGLLPSFYEPLNRMSWEMAQSAEETLAELLRARGHAVWQK